MERLRRSRKKGIGRPKIKKKTYVSFLLVMLLFLMLSSCKANETGRKQEKVPDVTYETGEVLAFCVDENGQIYTCEEGKDTISVYDSEGTKLREIAADGGTAAGNRYSVMYAEEGALYASDSVEPGIVRIDTASGAREVLYPAEIPEIWNLFDMTVCNGSLYFVCQKSMDLAEMELTENLKDGYMNLGEKAVRLDLETMKTEEIEISGVKRLCEKNAKEIWFYAFDQQEGFQYLVYDTEKGECSASYQAEKKTGLEGASVMTYDAAADCLLYPNSADGQLWRIDIAKGSHTEFYSTTQSGFGAHSLQCRNGYTYFVQDGKVMKIANTSYIKEAEPLKICTNSFFLNRPKSMDGHEVVLEELDTETITTKLLAGDSDFDLLVLSSADYLARHIEKIGAYEPLNHVEAIEAHLDSGFDYLREAATAENGAIWMMPYDVDCQVLLYQPELCKAYGIDFSGDLSYAEFSEYRNILYEATKTDSVWYEHQPDLWKAMLMRYVRDYVLADGSTGFDTEAFRRFAPVMKEMGERYNTSEFPILSPWDPEDVVRSQILNYYQSCAFSVVNKDIATQMSGLRTEQFTCVLGIYDCDFFEVKSMPSVEEGKPQKGLADILFYVVNPNSKRKAEALEYLAKVAENMAGTESIYWTKELTGDYNKLEQQMHDMYADANVVLGYPEDVMGAEYGYYLQGKISLEELIQKAERNFDIYLNE